MLTAGTNHSRYGSYYYNSGPLDIGIGIRLPLPPVGYVYIVTADGKVQLKPEIRPAQAELPEYYPPTVTHTTTANLVTALSHLVNA